jgi:biotin--protein ligase
MSTANRTSNIKINLYAGSGTSDRSVREIPQTITAALETLGLTAEIKLVKPEDLDKPSAFEDLGIFIIPGGADLHYIKSLSGERNKRIDNYVRAGGRIIGFCAGAYYLSKSVEFDKGGPLEVLGERETPLFLGTARGPVFGPYHYGSDEGGSIVELELCPEAFPDSSFSSVKVYFDGGCEFVNAAEQPNVTVLARYTRREKSAAIIEVRHGLGKGLLFGPHPELNLKSSPLISSNKEGIISTLERHSTESKWLLKAAISRLLSN